jgi:hypothetical protein
MQMKKTILFAAILVGMAFSGMAQQPSGAQVTAGNNLTANQDSAGNVSIKAGRTVSVDLDSSSLTRKWAGFFGTISGSIVLGDGANNLYRWTADEYPNAKVITIPKSNSVPSSLSTVGNPNSFLNPIDDSFDEGTDNASSTFNLSKETDPLGSGSPGPTAAVETFNSSQQRDSRFTTFLYEDADNAGNPVWVANATSQTSDSFNSDSVNYQMLIGVGEDGSGGAGTETYSFYLNLNS